MALGDGVRRDIATVSAQERTRFINAIVKLDTTKFFSDGVSYWDKQEDIHVNAHFAGVDVHAGPAFIPWHRVVVNRLEGLLREVDSQLSLHYWDWTTDPRVGSGSRAALFTPEFMGNASGDAGHLLQDFESSEDAIEGNGHTKIWRDVGGAPGTANPDGTPAIATDASILSGTNFQTFASALKQAHDFVAHSYIGGTVSDAHFSFHDPFVFLLHSNLDRLWARWQTEPGQGARMDPTSAYSGFTPSQLTELATENVEPWAGGTGLEPWASDPTKRAVVTYTDVSVVTPPCYDTNQDSFQVLAAENPWNSTTSRHQIVFNDVPEEETTWRAAVIRVYTCENATIRVKPGDEPGPPFTAVIPVDSVVHATAAPYTEARIWFQFTAGPVGSAPQTHPTVNTVLTCDETGEDFPFELLATTIPRPTVAVQLALDQSGSMGWAAGTSGSTRLQVLQDAADLFAALIQSNNGLGIIRFDQDAYPPTHTTYGGMPITRVLGEEFSDPARLAAVAAIGAHGAHGRTSVGDGLEMARNQLNSLTPSDYDETALLLFTDGIENEPKSIDDVSGSIDSQTYAVGLGNETQVNTYALSQVAGSTGGYLLLSGLLSSSLDDQFRLRKFFLQILAGIEKSSIVEDPIGWVAPGSQLRVPFVLSEADINAQVILLTQLPIVRMAIETPDGQLIDATNASAAGVHFDRTGNISVARFGLPILLEGEGLHEGTWHALLDVGEDADSIVAELYGSSHSLGETLMRRLQERGTPFCLSVHSFSNLRMTTTVSQTSFSPGSTVTIRAALTEYSLPVERRARVTAEVEFPDHTHEAVSLKEGEPGIFTTSIVAPIPGIYRFRIVAEGGTLRGSRFKREQLRTAAAWIGGDRPTRPPQEDMWCRLVACLTDEKLLSREVRARLEEGGVNLAHIRECLKSTCDHSHKGDEVR